MIYTITNLPLTVPYTPKPKFFRINLNQYKSIHHHSLAKAKRCFAHQVDVSHPSGLLPIPFPPPYQFHYWLQSRKAWFTDLGNAASVLDKFTADYLQEVGVIPDDTFTFINHIAFTFAGFVTPPHVPTAALRISPSFLQPNQEVSALFTPTLPPEYING